MSNRSNRSSAIVPATVLPDSRPAGDTTSPFRAVLLAAASKVAASPRRTVAASAFPAVDSPAFPAAVVAACEAVMSGQSIPDAAAAMSAVAQRLNTLGVRPAGKYHTGAAYGTRSALAGQPMWQKEGIGLVVAAHVAATPAE